MKARLMSVATWIVIMGAPLLPMIPLAKEGLVPSALLQIGVALLVGWRAGRGPDSGWGLAGLILVGLVCVTTTGTLVNRTGTYHDMFVATMTAWVALWVVVAPIMNHFRHKLEDAAFETEEDLKRTSAANLQRERELEYADRVRRQRNRIPRASTPGERTGFEPQDLKSTQFAPSSRTHGDPGAGLSGSGFEEVSIKRGQLGELNFAKALQATGNLARFETFWSVHMPDSGLGASRDFETDVDCVIVTDRSVWLIDVKNYVQGGVTWKIEDDDSASEEERILLSRRGESPQVLVAVDNGTQVNVGPPRKMSRNMALAVDRFQTRFRASNLNLSLKAAVVMMPQDDGMGVLEDVHWPGGIPALALQHFLQQISTETPPRPENEDARIASAILESLLKDESGSALRPGERTQSRPSDPR